MSFEPFMWATYCDDVRQEVGNKLSYLGIYQSNLIVPSFPTTLLKLCCILNVRVPANSPPKKVLFRLLRGDETIFEADVSQVESVDAPNRAPAAMVDPRVWTITSVAQLVNFQITEAAVLKSRAIVDGVELRGGALELQSAASLAAAAPHSR